MLGQVLRGNFAFDKVTTGASAGSIRVAASGVSLNLGGDAVRVADAAGFFLLSPTGMAGSISGTVSLTVPGVNFAGNFAVEINTTAASVDETIQVGGQTLTLQLTAGPFVRVTGEGVTLSVLGQTLTGNFSFEQVTAAGGEKLTTVIASNVSLSLGDGTTSFVSVTNGEGALLLTSAGLAGQLSGTIGINVPGVTFVGSFNLRINNTAQAVSKTSPSPARRW